MKTNRITGRSDVISLEQKLEIFSVASMIFFAAAVTAAWPFVLFGR